MKKSTRSFISEAQIQMKANRFSFFDFIHGYVYMRWPYAYISMGMGTHPLAKKLKPLLTGYHKMMKVVKKPSQVINNNKGVAEGYHGKTVSLSTAKKLVSINKEISLVNLEQIIPFKHACDIVLKNPDRIAVIECPCRKTKDNPCLPLDVCLIIGDPFASFVLDHHPLTARAVSPEQARQILEQEHSRGHVQHAFFKDAMLNRFYAICNCCACCCGAMQAQRNGTPMIISSGFSAQVDLSQCIECLQCIDTCQFGAISIENSIRIDTGLCMGCGICVDICPQGAITLDRNFSKPAPLVIEKLLEG